MAPELSVVVASHHRPLRLRWLLNALEGQTLEPSAWEVIVCYHDPDPETAALLADHPLARTGRLEAVAEPGVSVGAKRNVGVERARGETIVFTDDDCRPPAQWLERALEAVRRHPGAVIQGPIEGDPDEWAMRRSPYPLTQEFSDVPTPWAECCNIAYPRQAVLEAGGFSELWGEDTDLSLRVRAAGVPYRGEPSMLTFHAIVDASILRWIRSGQRWKDIPALFKRHPELRSELHLRVFWKWEHLWLLVALAGTAAAVRGPRWGALALAPWALGRGAHGESLRGRVRDLTELPGWAVIDLAELLALVRGSVRHRTIVL